MVIPKLVLTSSENLLCSVLLGKQRRSNMSEVDKNGKAFNGNWGAVFVAVGCIGLGVLVVAYKAVEAALTAAF